MHSASRTAVERRKRGHPRLQAGAKFNVSPPVSGAVRGLNDGFMHVMMGARIKHKMAFVIQGGEKHPRSTWRSA